MALNLMHSSSRQCPCLRGRASASFNSGCRRSLTSSSNTTWPKQLFATSNHSQKLLGACSDIRVVICSFFQIALLKDVDSVADMKTKSIPQSILPLTRT